ncbi:hypothetical protein [Streptomyces sp. NBC_01465]|uniref:hypothetical protein n=1 Tax=Streptomyces sp. NBC_01465 TaxID=2903878 RepID=UPI002E31DCAB|nr:hypothetical protein [Streptomyces sp. NBC_01465]
MDLAGELEGRPPRAPRPRRPWLWALGGAVVASAVWGGALFAYERGRDDGVDIKGYAVGADLCQKVRLKALTAAIGERERENDPVRWDDRNSTLDRARCTVGIQSAEEKAKAEKEKSSLSYSVGLSAALHKVTDPGPEFRATLSKNDWYVDQKSKVEEVPGLGDEAYMVTTNDGNAGIPELRVRDGSAVFTLNVDISMNSYGDMEAAGPKPPSTAEMAALQPAMIEDMRAMMAALKK